MVLVVNNIFASAGARNEVKSTTEKATAKGDDFYKFLSRSMKSHEPVNAAREKQMPVSSAGDRRIMKNELNGNKNGMVLKGDSEQAQEVLNSDSLDLKKSENILYVIDEIMALLQKLNIFFEKIELPDENEAKISIPEEIKSIVNQSVSMLLEVANCPYEDVSKLTQDMAGKMMQMLNDELQPAGSDIDITVITDHFKELLSEMLYEAENFKAEITVENIWESINPEIGNETELPDESGIPLQQQQDEVHEPESQEGLNNNNGVKDDNEEQKASADDVVNIAEKRNFNTVNASMREDINHVIRNDNAENTQVSEPVHYGPVRTSVINKADILHQVAEKVRVFTTSERSEMIIQLKPESLGKIQLQVIHERGEVIAKFLAENEQVKAILESNMQYLRDSLEKSGVDIQSLSVSVGQHNNDERDNYKSWNSQPNLQGIYYEDLPEVSEVSNTYEYTGLAGDYGYTGSEINLIA